MFLPHAVAAADREPTFDPPLVAAEGRAKFICGCIFSASLREEDGFAKVRIPGCLRGSLVAERITTRKKFFSLFL
jgi:hypothetical protein